MSMSKVIENSEVPVYVNNQGEMLVKAFDMYNYLNPEREFINWMDCATKKLQRKDAGLPIADVYKDLAGMYVSEYYFHIFSAREIVKNGKTSDEWCLEKYLHRAFLENEMDLLKREIDLFQKHSKMGA